MNVPFLCLPAAALTGVAALWLELGWLRTAAAALPGTVPAGALVVPVFLLAWAAGAAVGGRGADRSARGLSFAARWLGLAALAALLGPFLGERLLAGRDDVGLGARLALGGLPVVPAAFFLGGALPVLGAWRRRAGRHPARAAGAVAASTAVGGALGVGTFRPLGMAGHDPALLAVLALAAAGLLCWALDRVRAASAEDGSTNDAPGAASARGAGVASLAGAPGDVPASVLLWASVVAGALLVGGQLFALRVAAHVSGDTLASTSEILGWLHAGMALGAVVLCRAGSSRAALALSAWLLAAASAALLLFDPTAGPGTWARALPVVLLGFGAGNLVTAVSRAAVRPRGRFGSWIGDVSAGATAGGVLGGLAVTVILVPHPAWGTPAGARLLALCGLGAALVLGVLGCVRRGLRGAGILGLLAVVCGGAVFLARPAWTWPWRGDAFEVELLALSEGAHGVVTLVRTADGEERLEQDSRFGLSGSGGRLEQRLGRVSAALHPEARDVLLLGLGRGNTLAGLSDTSRARIDCVEHDAQILALGLGVPYQPGRAPRGPTPNVHHADARRWIASHPRAYDLVVGDLFVPWRTGAGDLLTVENFARVRGALRDGGVAVQWLPLHQLPWPAFAAVCRAFLESFPDARLLVATPLSSQPLVALVGGLGEGLPRAETVDELFASVAVPEGPAGHADLADLVVCDAWALAERFREAPMNTRAQPLSELLSLERQDDEAFLARTNLALLADLVRPLDVLSSGRLTGAVRDTRALGVELEARAAALSALLAARAALGELATLPVHDERSAADEDQARDVTARLHTALLAAWTVFPGHLGARQALLERGASLSAEGRLLDAATLLADAVRSHADGPLAAMLGGVLLRLGRAHDAVDVLRQARPLAPDHGSLLVNLGSALVHVGEDAEAAEALRLASTVFRPRPLPPLQHTVLALLDGEARALPEAAALRDAMPADEPWRGVLERLMSTVGDVGG